MQKETRGFRYIYVGEKMKREVSATNPGQELMPINPDDIGIIEKITRTVNENHFEFLHKSILSRNLFGIESCFVEENPEAVKEYSGNNLFDIEKEVKLYTNDKAGKMGRASWFITKRSTIPAHQELIDEWQVVVSSANAGGQKRSNQLAIIDNHSAFGRSRVALKSFKTQKEADNFFKYASSYLVRYAFLMTDESLTSLAKRVPDIMNYKDSNGIIDFSKDVNEQLYKLFNISSEERTYIEGIIDKKDGKV